MKRLRPGMPPIAIQLEVAHRQLIERGIWNSFHLTVMHNSPTPKISQLRFCLSLLFPNQKTHLDHNPALRIRKYNHQRATRAVDRYNAGRIDGAEKSKLIAACYTPNAHDPRWLEHRSEDGHKTKTHHRGDGAQHSDRVLIKKERKRERNRKQAKPIKRHVAIRTKNKVSLWPQGRKIRSRGFQ